MGASNHVVDEVGGYFQVVLQDWGVGSREQGLVFCCKTGVLCWQHGFVIACDMCGALEAPCRYVGMS